MITDKTHFIMICLFVFSHAYDFVKWHCLRSSSIKKLIISLLTIPLSNAELYKVYRHSIQLFIKCPHLKLQLVTLQELNPKFARNKRIVLIERYLQQQKDY